jgi:hypothetical protein
MANGAEVNTVAPVNAGNPGRRAWDAPEPRRDAAPIVSGQPQQPTGARAARHYDGQPLDKKLSGVAPRRPDDPPRTFNGPIANSQVPLPASEDRRSYRNYLK